jgi:hypothetical protein
MVLADAIAHSGHVKVIRCNSKPGLIERSRVVENGTISEKI